MLSRSLWRFILLLSTVLSLRAVADAQPLNVVSSTPTVDIATVTVLHPTEGMHLPALSQVFSFGAVTPGATLTINGEAVPVHALGGYLTMVRLKPGENVLTYEVKTSSGQQTHLDRHVFVEAPPTPLAPTPLAIDKASITPQEDLTFTAGDPVRVSFQGSPQASAQFALSGMQRALPMVENAALGPGFYEGSYIVQPSDHGNPATIEVSLKGHGKTLKEKAKGRLFIDGGQTPRLGVVLDEQVAVRTGVEGGYDVFLYKGMRVRLTGRADGMWRVRLSSIQSGWVKESAIQELPQGTVQRPTVLSNISVVHQDDSALVRIPLGEMLPYRTEQMLDPMQLVITLYGAVDRTDLIRQDPLDPLIKLVRWRQIAPDTCQVILQPTFKKWWGYDVRYENGTLLVEIRKPWTSPELRGMVIAIDAGHGGSDKGADGPHGLLEKDANLEIAKTLRDVLERAGAKPFMTREKDVDVPLYERPKLAWNHNARLFISVHCNSSGLWENPVINNGYSVYYYHPQSLALARAVHAQYARSTGLMDHGLYYADFAVCRMTQMPAILTEQAFIIVPEQEQLLFDPAFQKSLANGILRGIRDYLQH